MDCNVTSMTDLSLQCVPLMDHLAPAAARGGHTSHQGAAGPLPHPHRKHPRHVAVTRHQLRHFVHVEHFAVSQQQHLSRVGRGSPNKSEKNDNLLIVFEQL